MSAERRIAILGGGMGSLTAAYRLARTTDASITVYQRDHLLGGKGSSTRKDDERYAYRIEEHGVHVLMGWYDNAIGVLREVYEDLEDDPADPRIGRVRRWDDVLIPHNAAAMAESPQLTGADWEFWRVPFPKRRGKPGIAAEEDTLEMRVVRTLHWLAFFRDKTARTLNIEQPAPKILLEFGVTPEETADDWMEKEEALTPERAERLYDLFQSPASSEALETDMQVLSMGLENPLHVLGWTDFAFARRFMMATWFAAAMALGLKRLNPKTRADYDKLDAMEFREWLRSNGPGWPKNPLLTTDSPIVRILYDLAFGHGRKFAAGVWAYAAQKFAFDYKGSFVFKMNGGMGDIVFAPLYLQLRKLGVEFRFMSEVTKLETDRNGNVSKIHLVERPLPPDYEPLIGIDIPGVGQTPCWPEKVRAVPGDPREVVLTLGDEGPNGFDDVVLGISVGGLSGICDDLIQRSPRFRSMVESSATVGTRCAQIWLNRDCKDLGWKTDDFVACFERPFNSCVQMSHTLDSEPWTGSAADKPVDCVYYCDDAPEGTTDDDVRNSLQEFLTNSGRSLMPGFTFEALVDPENRGGSARLDAQYWRANMKGSDRYVITPPGSTRNRLGARESDFPNLALAGDWVTTDINAGCLEAATIGGLDAADWLTVRHYQHGGPRLLRAPGAGLVDSPVSWIRPHPLELTNATLRIVPIAVNEKAAAKMCREMFQEPTNGKVVVEPILGRALAVFADIPEARSIAEKDDGYLRETEFTIFLPVRVRRGASFRVGVVVPFSIVSDPVGVIAGRELFGFPKNVGPVEKLQASPLHILARTYALREFARGNPAVLEDFVELRERGPAAAAADPLSGIAAWARVLDVLARPGVGTIAALLGMLTPTIHCLFLRQLRDVARPESAAYQEVLAVPASIHRFRSARLHHGPFDVRFPQLDRPDIQKLLGVPPAQVVDWLIEMRVDFGFGRGESLWS